MNKNKNVGCFSGILGTLFVILGVIGYALVSSYINRLFIGARFGNDASVALLELSLTGLTVAFVLYEAIFIVSQIRLHKNASGKDDGGKMNRIYRLVFVGCVCLSLLFAIFSANTFTECDGDSISKVCFVTTKEYRWDEENKVTRYALGCDADGNLTYKIFIRGEKPIELFNTVNSCTDSFIEKYGGMEGYAAYLSEQFDNSDHIIEKEITGIEYMERYYKEDYPEIWKHLETIINDSAE